MTTPPTPTAFPAEVSSGRVALRVLEPGDAEALVRVTDHAVITERISFLPSPFSRADAVGLAAEAATETQRLYAVTLDGKDLIGFFGAHLRDGGEMEIGYWIDPVRQGQGYASETLGLMCMVLKAYFPERKIYAECMPDNAASLRILSKNGFSGAGVAGKRPGRDKYLLK